MGAATIASLLTLSWATSTGAATTDASSLLAAALHDATSETSVHEVALTTQSSTTEQEDNDIGVNAGIQQFAVSNGALADVIALDAKKKLYIRGNTYALTNFFGLDLVDPSSYANDWLLVTPKDPNYGAVALATTLASDFDLSRSEGPPRAWACHDRRWSACSRNLRNGPRSRRQSLLPRHGLHQR